MKCEGCAIECNEMGPREASVALPLCSDLPTQSEAVAHVIEFDGT